MACAQVKTRHEEFIEDVTQRVIYVLDHKFSVIIVTFMTMWALFMDDMQYGFSMPKDVDVPFAWVTLVFLVVFCVEQLARSIAQCDKAARTSAACPARRSLKVERSVLWQVL